MSKPARTRFLVAMTVGCSMLACSSTPLGASNADVARARSRAAQGASVYERQCAACHGDRGEGLAGSPPVMGEGALPVHPREPGLARQYSNEEQKTTMENNRPLLSSATRPAFVTARDLHDFLHAHMPKIRQQPDPLAPSEYWQVVTFLVVVKGKEVPPSGVDASTADAIRLAP